MALPRVVPATVVSAARTPRVAPVEMTSVTIGPGMTIRTIVMRRKAVKSWAFMFAPARRRATLRCFPEEANGQRGADGDNRQFQQLLVDCPQHQGASPAAERGADRSDERLQPIDVLRQDQNHNRRGVDRAGENVLRRAGVA